MHIHDLIEEKAHRDAGYAIAYALLQLADAHRGAAYALKALGVGNAATEMGAVEALAMEVKGVAEAINEIAGRMPDEE